LGQLNVTQGSRCVATLVYLPKALRANELQVERSESPSNECNESTRYRLAATA